MTLPVEVVVSQYLQSLEAGTAPSCEEFPNLHPECRVELAQFLDTHAQLQSTFSTLRDSTTLPAFPRRFGLYYLLGELGSGGMGVVYRARHIGHERDVALKMIRSVQFCSEKERIRFRSEIAAAMQLQHPNLTPVLDAGEIDGLQYYTMPVHDAGNLYHHRLRFAATPDQAAAIVRDLAMGIDHAHRNGILHRDLKPSNVLFSQLGQPQITDFGLAKNLHNAMNQTRTDQIVGTPAYNAPECLDYQPATTASDIYGLGAILYFALTGEAPTQGRNEQELILALRYRESIPPSRLNPQVSRDLDAIVLQCLNKDPERRYPSAAALADDLERYLDGRSVLARPPGRMEKIVRGVRRHPLIASLITVVFALIAFSGLVMWQRYDESIRLNDALEGALKREHERYQDMRQFDYAGRMRSAADAMKAGRLEDASEILSSLFPKGDEADIREFTWHHFWRTARTRQRVPAHLKSIVAVAISPDGKYYATAGNDDQISLIDPDSGNIIRKWNTQVALFDHGFFKMCFSRDSTQIITGYTEYSSSTTKLSLWDVSNGAVIATNTVPMNRLGGFIPRDNGIILVQGGTAKEFSGQMYEWNTRSNTVDCYRDDQDGAHMQLTNVVSDNYVYLTRSKFLNVTDASDQIVQLELSTNSLKHVGVLNCTCRNLSCSPDGRWLAASDCTNTLYVWNLDEMELVFKKTSTREWRVLRRWFGSTQAKNSLSLPQCLVVAGHPIEYQLWIGINVKSNEVCHRFIVWNMIAFERRYSWAVKMVCSTFEDSCQLTDRADSRAIPVKYGLLRSAPMVRHSRVPLMTTQSNFTI